MLVVLLPFSPSALLRLFDFVGFVCCSVVEASENGATWADMGGDFEKGFVKISPDPWAGDVSTQSQGAKRSAPIGTPDRNADARAKQLMQATSADVTTERVEMSAATIGAPPRRTNARMCGATAVCG